MTTSDTNYSDVAALSAAVVAGAIIQFVTAGPYDWLSLALGLTLSSLVISYVWSHSRSSFQSFAVGGVLGLTLLPVVGFVWDATSSVACYGTDVLGREVLDSCLEGYQHGLVWVFVAFITLATDQMVPKRSAVKALDDA